MLRKPQKPPEGAKMKETADMVVWRKEFEKMKTEDHKSKLKELGLDEEDLEEFEALEKGEKTLEDELGAGEKAVEEAPAEKKKGKK
ncbi:MAG: hypothetical protein NTY48_06575 [Candidatus Diapherotrites archaeon]|nr:hypothetical protein [Candidatus Diapherotrites archaeon]